MWTVGQWTRISRFNECKITAQSQDSPNLSDLDIFLKQTKENRQKLAISQPGVLKIEIHVAENYVIEVYEDSKRLLTSKFEEKFKNEWHFRSERLSISKNAYHQ